MMEYHPDQSVLKGLVGRWHGTTQHRVDASCPFIELSGTSDNRWVLGGRFVEMTLRAGNGGDTWSAVFYIGYERTERRHILVSVQPGDRRITTRLGTWRLEHGRFVLTGDRSRAVCDMTIPGQLKLELVEDIRTGSDFVAFRAEFRMAVAPVFVTPERPREHKRFVIA